jgi:hypothetical protein
VRRALAGALLALTACGKIQGLDGGQPPLVSFDVTFTGDLAPLRPAGVTSERALRVALVWGAQWLIEPICILPPESEAAGLTLTAGCREPFGFVPMRVGPSVPLVVGETTSLPLLELPSADLLVGDLTGRVGYASLIVFDDRDGDGTLALSRAHPTTFGADDRRGDDVEDVQDAVDILYGASFARMTEPDRRVAYREGSFDATSAYYPRAGCGGPPPGFSIVGAGGFTVAAGLAASAAGKLPAEDPAACFAAAVATTVDLVARASSEIEGVGCEERALDGTTRYHEPPATVPDFTGRSTACAHLPSFGGAPSTVIQLLVSGRAVDRCQGLTHYALRGCRENVSCPVPDWDITATPPLWWPCH